MTRRPALAAALLAAPLLLALAPSAPPVSTWDGEAAGTIEGRVTAPARPPRRTTDGYGGLAGAPHVIPPVPMVAYLEGDGGERTSSEGVRPRLTQRDTSFQPSVLVVPVGTTVDFPNQDPFFHNVFSYSTPKRFDLGRYPRGESRPVRFDRPGAVKVYCEIHRWMRAGIVVVRGSHHAQVRPDGTFRLAGVAAGRHRLTVWDFDRGARTVTVDVPAQGSVRVDVRF